MRVARWSDEIRRDTPNPGTQVRSGTEIVGEVLIKKI